MERYLLIAGSFIAIAAFVPAAVFFFRAVKHFIKMRAHFRSTRHEMMANFVPFAFLFMPQLFTEQGNVHRREHVKNLTWFLCCLALIAVLFTLLGIR